jgi:hypothetical protein
MFFFEKFAEIFPKKKKYVAEYSFLKTFFTKWRKLSPEKNPLVLGVRKTWCSKGWLVP